MEDEEIIARIACLDALIAPLEEERTILKRRLGTSIGGKISGQVRRDKNAARNKRIEKRLINEASDLYKRPDGLITKIAKEEGVSTRTVSKIRANLKNKNLT